MKTITISEDLLSKLETVEGKEINEKILNLLETNVLMRLRECEDMIFKYESKYGMDFESFKNAWEQGIIKDKYSHKVERDFIEWEGFESERRQWLKLLNDMRAKKTFDNV